VIHSSPLSSKLRGDFLCRQQIIYVAKQDSSALSGFRMKRFYFGMVCALFVAMVCAVVLPSALVAATPVSLVLAMFVAKLLEAGVWHVYTRKQPDSTRRAVAAPQAAVGVQATLAKDSAEAPLSETSEKLVQDTYFSAKDLNRIFAKSNKDARRSKGKRKSR
jgi:hypothetical protein